MSKHSPGPWAWGSEWIKGGDGNRVARLTDVSPADARLIAAAPELLEALKATLACLSIKHRRGGMGFGAEEITLAVGNAYALIRRIEGEE